MPARQAEGRKLDGLATQIYLISPLNVAHPFGERLVRAIDASEGMVAAFQFRLKGIGDREAAFLAEPLQRICSDRNIAFIVNDNVSLAKHLNADGVHLGQSDVSVQEARKALGRESQIGVTCHDSKHLAMEAGEAGANYVAFGAFFASKTKETNHRPEVSLIEWWTKAFEIPCVAIGGISPENCSPLISAGVDFLAVSASVWDTDEVASIKSFVDEIKKK